ncbi:MAG: type II toxin-antitoxin system death-on-curing family toxin [Planctomycetes bacterium]|nr:type II toxin-antitoxin system death-on-curing family toxin [Planctomycetota bacterium]
MNWISLEELLLLHARVVEASGGGGGVVHAGSLESALQRPFTQFDGVEHFATLHEKVAAMTHSIIAFHPFIDGNKRTALVAADVVYRLNGLRISPSKAVEDFFWSIARGEQDVPAIATWLAEHTERWTTPQED